MAENNIGILPTNGILLYEDGRIVSGIITLTSKEQDTIHRIKLLWIDQDVTLIHQYDAVTKNDEDKKTVDCFSLPIRMEASDSIKGFVLFNTDIKPINSEEDANLIVESAQSKTVVLVKIK